MSCACGHHHTTRTDDAGTPARLSVPMVELHGSLTCTDMGQMMTALSLLPDHVELSRAEPGCLRFDITQAEDPMVWTLSEVFADADAFAAHQARTADSVWGRDSGDMARDFHRHDLHPLMRAEVAGDHAPLDRLLTSAFGSPAEGQLLRGLRDSGDLEMSLVAHAKGVPVGHVALSRLSAERPALALAPLAVHPALQGRGLGTALVHMALQAAGERPVVVLGDPAFYGRMGFVPANLQSPYAGPALQIFGDLPKGSTIIHAAAFSDL
ncbi:GNAT family N-acetyltransferase [Paracoccus sp. SM22M-07]|uniref:GNAT family N-acetyltransferase n=1 Tax=Paracoccus sp. SM22M-07 TaxID=1520813 RepID=UPI00091EE5E1|nr:GNAT family N-acetyltransferase [Paracoccus sp. SM22M-07]OJH43379.1 GCN5 family acetyltransferase [Paracoccus sp. SM22M-07]